MKSVKIVGSNFKPALVSAEVSRGHPKPQSHHAAVCEFWAKRAATQVVIFKAGCRMHVSQGAYADERCIRGKILASVTLQEQASCLLTGLRKDLWLKPEAWTRGQRRR